MRLTSGVRRTATGGWGGPAPRRLRAPATPSRTASRYRAHCPTFIARSRSSAWRRSSRLFRPSSHLGELPGHGERREVLGATLEPHERARILPQIARPGIDLVAKEAGALSTTPIWPNGPLEPPPLPLRLFLARPPDRWPVVARRVPRLA